MRSVGTPAEARSLPRPMLAVSVLHEPVLSLPSDAVLLERFAAGDRTALDALFNRTARSRIGSRIGCSVRKPMPSTPFRMRS